MGLVLIFLRAHTALSATYNEYLLFDLMTEWVHFRSFKSKIPHGHQGRFWSQGAFPPLLNWVLWALFITQPCGSDGKESACDAGDWGLIPGLGRSSEEGNDNLLPYSCLESWIHREAWQATVCEVAKSWRRLSDSHTHALTCTHWRSD